MAILAVSTRTLENHPPTGAESPLWRTRIGASYRIIRLMLPRIRDVLVVFASRLALLSCIVTFRRAIHRGGDRLRPAEMCQKKGHSE